MKRFTSFLTALALLISVGMPISTAFASVPVEWANGTAPEAATTSSETTDTSTDTSTASTTTTTPVCTTTTEEYEPQTASGVPVEWGAGAPASSVITTTVCTNPDGSVTTTVESPRGTTTTTTQPTASSDADDAVQLKVLMLHHLKRISHRILRPWKLNWMLSRMPWTRNLKRLIRW